MGDGIEPRGGHFGWRTSTTQLRSRIIYCLKVFLCRKENKGNRLELASLPAEPTTSPVCPTLILRASHLDLLARPPSWTSCVMGNPPQGEDTPLLDIGEQLTTNAVNAARRRRMLAGRVDFHRFSTPSSASTCSLCSIIHSSACCVLEMR